MDLYDELCCYTLGHGDATFIHQHVVDAHAAQTADATMKPIRLVFALVGLYLHLERGFTGRQVQLAHMELAREKRAWPAIPLPADRGSVTVVDVMAAAEGTERDAAIDAWCASVWNAYRDAHSTIATLLADARIRA